MVFSAHFIALRPFLRLSSTSPICLNLVRYASLNSAIGRGIRKSNALDDFQGLSNHGSDRPKKHQDRGDRTSRSGYREPRESQHRGFAFERTETSRKREKYTSQHERRRGLPDIHYDPRPVYANGKRRQAGPPQPESTDYYRGKRHTEAPLKSRSRQSADKIPEKAQENVKVPDEIPYTTPASEFIYGTSAVEAALRCSRRQMYKLYLYVTTGEEMSADKLALRKIALSKNIRVKPVVAGWDRLLDKMSAGRPHNGCILEASPLPRLPVKSFKPVELQDTFFQLELATQSREQALINGVSDRIPIYQPIIPERRRYPVVLLLEGILDPGNLGAIIRSAYYLGVEAVVFAGRNSAPLSPIAIKASAGAAENMTILEVKNEVEFIKQSKANGWRFYAADAPSPGSTFLGPASPVGGENTESGNGQQGLSGPLGSTPSVIMMGNEGTGLSSHIKMQADSIVSIPGARLDPNLGVASDPARIDSLNVSVAAALLIEMFLRVPLAITAVPQGGRFR